jgi:HEAT repeat protein
LEDLQNLLSELSAPVKIFRVFAIEKAIREGNSQELLQTLKTRKQIEDDAECCMLLDHAISAVSERLPGVKSAPKKDSRVTPAEFARMTPQEQLQAINKTPTSTLKKDGAVQTINILWQSTSSPVVQAEIIKRCTHFWPEQLADLLETCLSSDSTVLQIASLETVINRFPERLQKNFDKLVMSSDPIIRATAIRGLARRHPQSAAVFLAQSLRKGDYYTRLAALRAISVMPFNLNRSSLIELLSHENDEKLLKILSAIIISNPDREMPFRICDLIEKAPPERQKYLLELQKNCCAMIKMAELCPDYKQYMATVARYPKRLKARKFVQSCISTYENADTATRKELVNLLREKMQVQEVAEAVAAQTSTEKSELLHLAATKAEPAKTPVLSSSASETVDDPEELMKTLLRIRIAGEKSSSGVIAKAFGVAKPGSALLPAAFRAAVINQDSGWLEKARKFLRNDNEDLVAAALEYLATFDSENFLLQIRLFINSPSLIIRTSLLRSLCRLNPESARQLLASMLSDKELRVREKAISSLVHFEFAEIRDLLTTFLERENNVELVSACLSFYLTNPVMESTCDLEKLANSRPTLHHLFAKTGEALKESLCEFGIASEEEIAAWLQKCREENARSQASEAENHEKARLNDLARKVTWNSLSDTFSGFSQYYPLLKGGFLAFMFLVALFFFLTGSAEDSVPETIEGFTPIAAEITDYNLTVQSFNPQEGSITAISDDRQKILALPRPGKAFVARPGDQIKIRAMPFRILPDKTLAVKTIEIKKP